MIQKIGIVPGDPTAPVFHRFRSESAEHLLIVPFSRVFDLSSELARGFDAPLRINVYQAVHSGGFALGSRAAP